MSPPLAKIRLRDFLMPERLLAATDAEDNPFVRHGERRRSRAWRIAVRTLLAILLAGFCVACLEPQLFGIDLTPWGRGWGFRQFRDANWSSGPLGLDGGWFFAVFAVAAFVLLRYNMFVNDQSHHMKSIAREQLEHLMLSRLGPNEYFLHHLLLFCRRYDVVVGFAALLLLCAGAEILTGAWQWVRPGYWQAHVVLLGICLLAWPCGALQYVAEWRLFAASRLQWLRAPVSLLLSAVAAVPIAVVALVLRDSDDLAGLPIMTTLFLVGAAIAHVAGRRLYAASDAILWNRFVGQNSAERRDTPSSPGGGGVLALAGAAIPRRPSCTPWPHAPAARDWATAAVGAVFVLSLATVVLLKLPIFGRPAVAFGFGAYALFGLGAGFSAALFALLAVRVALREPRTPRARPALAATRRFALLAVPVTCWAVLDGIQQAGAYGTASALGLAMIVLHVVASWNASLLMSWFISLASAFSVVRVATRCSPKVVFALAAVAVAIGQVLAGPLLHGAANWLAGSLWRSVFSYRSMGALVQATANLAATAIALGLPLVAALFLAAWATGERRAVVEPVSPCPSGCARTETASDG